MDQSFVRDIDRDPDNLAIVGAIINLGHTLRLTVVAEGVESVAELDRAAPAPVRSGAGLLFLRAACRATDMECCWGLRRFGRTRRGAPR